MIEKGQACMAILKQFGIEFFMLAQERDSHGLLSYSHLLATSCCWRYKPIVVVSVEIAGLVVTGVCPPCSLSRHCLSFVFLFLVFVFISFLRLQQGLAKLLHVKVAQIHLALLPVWRRRDHLLS